MENEEIREKILCILRNRIQDFKKTNGNGEQIYLDTDYVRIIVNLHYAIWKTKAISKNESVKPKYFWQERKNREYTAYDTSIDYITARIFYEGYDFTLTKEEYKEIMEIRDKKIKEKQLEELSKLCKNN